MDLLVFIIFVIDYILCMTDLAASTEDQFNFLIAVVQRLEVEPVIVANRHCFEDRDETANRIIDGRL